MRWILCCLGLLGLLCILALVLQLAGGDWNRPLNLGQSTNSQPEVPRKVCFFFVLVRFWQIQIVWNQKKTLKKMTWQWLTCCFWWPERCLNTWCVFELQQSFCQAVSQALQQCASPFFRDQDGGVEHMGMLERASLQSQSYIGSELQRRDVGRFIFFSRFT